MITPLEVGRRHILAGVALRFAGIILWLVLIAAGIAVAEGHATRTATAVHTMAATSAASAVHPASAHIGSHHAMAAHAAVLLVRQEQVDRYELIGNRIVFYLSGLTDGDTIVLPYELEARYVVRAQTPSGEAYNYYAPDQTAIAAPQRIVVTLATP